VPTVAVVGGVPLITGGRFAAEASENWQTASTSHTRATNGDFLAENSHRVIR
jgi:hypothetical protein